CAHVDLLEHLAELAKARLGRDRALESSPPALGLLVPMLGSLMPEVDPGPHVVRERMQELRRLLGGTAVRPVVAAHRLDGCGVENERAHAPGYVAAKSIVIAPPRAAPKIAAASLPAASITALRSSICSSRYGRSGPRSERPIPRMSKTISLE